MWAGRKKLDAHAGPFVRSVAEIHYPAFLLFFRHWIDEDQFSSEFQRPLDVKQPAVRVDDHGLAVFAELASVNILAGGTHWNAREDPGTAAFSCELRHHAEYRDMPAAQSQRSERECVLKKAERNKFG